MKRSLLLLSLIALILTQPFSAAVLYANEAGSIERDTILGVPCRIYLPNKYAERVQTGNIVFPVLYLQHGMFGSEDDWTIQGNLYRWMNMLLLAGQVKEMVVIMPDNFLGSMPLSARQSLMEAPNITPEGETFDTQFGSAHWRKLTRDQEQNYEMSGYWEEHFREFMAEAERRYSISTNPSLRAIAGLSMGGFHTMHVSHYLHGQFAHIGLFSPVIIPRRDEDLAAATIEDSQFHTMGFDLQLEYGSPAYDNWMTDLRSMVAAPPMYWIGIGRDDFLYAHLQDYRLWLDMNNFEYTYYESNGGHTWVNWQDYLCRFLKKLFWDEKY